MSAADEDAAVAEVCDQLLGLLRQTCGKDLNADSTEWCARKHGHDGACSAIPGGVRL